MTLRSSNRIRSHFQQDPWKCSQDPDDCVLSDRADRRVQHRLRGGAGDAPDLMHVRHQIGVMSRIASSFLIPDNHIGRATVSSIAVAHEVALMGGRSIACLNARDRNILGFQRDLLTAAAYGVDEFLSSTAIGPRQGDGPTISRFAR